MIRHTQTLFGDGSNGDRPGNCLQTAVASLLDLPMEDVPHFVEPEDWWSCVLAWVNEMALRLTIYAPIYSLETAYPGDYLITAPLEDAPPAPILIASGTTVRGLRHVVLYRDGKLVHDPHPSGVGLLGDPDEFWKLESRTSSESGSD